jgi:hypothetical protein
MLKLQRNAGPGEPCKVGRIYLMLDSEDRKLYREAIEDEVSWSAIALERQLRKNGVMISNDTILEHRKGNCRCEGWPHVGSN